MAEASVDTKPDTAPDASALAQEVEKLKTERDGAIGRAQKRYTEKLHAQADVRRAQKEIQILQHQIQTQDAASTNLLASYQVTIAELKEQLANVDGSSAMNQVQQQQMQQQHAAQVQQMQAEHNRKIEDARNGAQKLIAEKRVEDSYKVQVAQQAEQKAKDEANALRDEANALRDEVKELRDKGIKKDEEIAYLKKEIQNKTDQLELAEARRAPEPQRWTPQQQLSPKVVRTPTHRNGDPSTLGNPSISSHATPGLFEASDGNGSLTPHGDRTRQAFTPQTYSTPPPSQLTSAVEGEPMGSFVAQAVSNTVHRQQSPQPGMQNGPRKATPQYSSQMSPPPLHHPTYPKLNQGSLRRGTPSRAVSKVKSSPRQKQQSTAADLSNAFSDNIRSAMQQTSSQMPVPRAPSRLSQNCQRYPLGPNGPADFYDDLSNHLQSAMSRPAPSSPVLSSISQVSQSTPFQVPGILEPMFHGQPEAMQSGSSPNGAQGPSQSPSLHQPTPVNWNNMRPLDSLQTFQSSPSHHNNVAYNDHGQSLAGNVVGGYNELHAQMSGVSRTQHSFDNVMQNGLNLPPPANNHPTSIRRSPRLRNRQLAGNPHDGHQAALFNAAQVSQASRQQQQTSNAVPNSYGSTPNLNLHQIPVLQQLRPNAIVLTPVQKDLMQHVLQTKNLHYRVKEIMEHILLRMVPENGDRHASQQYSQAHYMATSYTEWLAKNPQQPGAQQNMNQLTMFLHSQHRSPNPQLQPHGYQTHPGQRSRQPPTQAPPQQTHTMAAPTSAVGYSTGQYTGVACTNCHEIWANQWCDGNEPCENCASTGAECKRPACEFADVPKAQCSKHTRCNRAHRGEGWTVADYRKDLKRKGKQHDQREWTAKRRRLESI